MGNLTEVLIPYVKYLFRMRAERRSDPQQSHQDVEGTQAETGLYLEQYDRKFSAFSFRFRFSFFCCRFCWLYDYACGKAVTRHAFYETHLTQRILRIKKRILRIKKRILHHNVFYASYFKQRVFSNAFYAARLTQRVLRNAFYATRLRFTQNVFSLRIPLRLRYVRPC